MRFLSDAQSPEPLVATLLGIGWDVQTARQHRLETEPRDELVLAACRTMGRILLSFDLFEGQTRMRVEDELRKRGGKVLTVAGGPEQPYDEAIGKLYYHRPKWRPFLEHEDGWVEIRELASGQLACHLRRASDLSTRLQHKDVVQLKGYLTRPPRPSRKTRRPQVAQPGQVVTDFDGADLRGSMPGLIQ